MWHACCGLRGHGTPLTAELVPRSAGRHRSLPLRLPFLLSTIFPFPFLSVSPTSSKRTSVGRSSTTFMPSPPAHHPLRLAFALTLSLSALGPRLVRAYSWQFDGTPTQCSNVSLSITGSGGTAPYTMLMVPSGPSPLSIEARRIQQFTFDGTSLTFDVNYPENSEFIAVVRLLFSFLCVLYVLFTDEWVATSFDR